MIDPYAIQVATKGFFGPTQSTQIVFLEIGPLKLQLFLTEDPTTRTQVLKVRRLNGPLIVDLTRELDSIIIPLDQPPLENPPCGNTF